MAILPLHPSYYQLPQRGRLGTMLSLRSSASNLDITHNRLVEVRSSAWSDTTASSLDSRHYHTGPSFVADITRAIGCMDVTKPCRQEVVDYFLEGDVHFARRNTRVIDVILSRILTPSEPFGIVDPECLPPWAFALQLLTIIQGNILDFTTNLMRDPTGKRCHAWFDYCDVTVVRRILMFCNELMAHALYKKVCDRTSTSGRVQDEVVIDYIWVSAILFRFDEKFLPLQHFCHVVISIWDKGICNTKYMFFLMDAIYRFGPSLIINGIGETVFDDEEIQNSLLGRVFPLPRTAPDRDTYAEWQESLLSRVSGLYQRLLTSQDPLDILHALKFLERTLGGLYIQDAEFYLSKGIFQVASDACLRGMKEADRLKSSSLEGVPVSSILSDMLQSAYLVCVERNVSGSLCDLMKSQMQNRLDFVLTPRSPLNNISHNALKI